jgi:hypothetical protein
VRIDRRTRAAKLARLILVVAMSATACSRTAPVASVAPAFAACPAPHVNTTTWRTVADSFVTFRLPAGFVEQPFDEGARRWYLNGDFSEYVRAGYIASSSPAEAMGRVPSPGMMEMSQCVDSIGGHQVLVQAWRTHGGTFRNGQRMDRYDVFAVVPVSPERRFYLTSGSHRPQTQQTVLEVVRTIALPARPD